MADGIFNIAKGKHAELWDRVEQNDPTNAVIVVMLLKVAEADATLQDYATFATLLAGSNTESDATSYARVVLDDTDLSSAVAVDQANDRMNITTPNVTWTPLGGGTDHALVKVVFGYDSDSSAGDDTNIIPLYHYDLSYTTVGNNYQINSGVIARSS